MPAPAAPHRPRPAAGLAALRGLGVLLVLLGVLAMHAVAGGNHMANMAADRARASLSVASVSTAERTGPGAMSAMSAPALFAPAAGPARGFPEISVRTADVGSSGMGAVCVAVLFGLVLLMARTAAVSVTLAVAPAPRSAGHGSAPLGRGPPRQLLARLCVLRT